MNKFSQFLLENHFPRGIQDAVYRAFAILEATNINKAYLLQQAGDQTAFDTAKQAVREKWSGNDMDRVVSNQKLRDRVLNLLYLFEIRKPGFTTDEVIHHIHDLSVAGSLAQRWADKVNSDTTPDDAARILGEANAAAVQSQKPYPDLTPEEEEIWLRVKTYHEFPDGFKWVYAVDERGSVAPSIPSNITHKTMRHCGNAPQGYADSGDQYYELRDSNNKAYLTVILNSDDCISESKSFGNSTNRYRQQILPYVKWFLQDKKVRGVGRRYDYGYATDKNFGVKDFIEFDPEFVDYVIENKPELIGNTETKILFWRDAIREGVVTEADMVELFINRGHVERLNSAISKYGETAKFKVTDGDLWGHNRFEVLCAACGHCPIPEPELIKLIESRDLKFEEFANHDIKLLTPAIQRAFLRADPRNLDKLIKVDAEVAAFHMDPGILVELIPTDPDAGKGGITTLTTLLKYISKANPPSSVVDLAERVLTDKTVGMLVERTDARSVGWHYDDFIGYLFDTYARFPERKIDEWPFNMIVSGMYPVGHDGTAGYALTEYTSKLSDRVVVDMLERLGFDATATQRIYKSDDQGVGVPDYNELGRWCRLMPSAAIHPPQDGFNVVAYLNGLGDELAARIAPDMGADELLLGIAHRYGNNIGNISNNAASSVAGLIQRSTIVTDAARWDENMFGLIVHQMYIDPRQRLASIGKETNEAIYAAAVEYIKRHGMLSDTTEPDDWMNFMTGAAVELRRMYGEDFALDSGMLREFFDVYCAYVDPAYGTPGVPTYKAYTSVNMMGKMSMSGIISLPVDEWDPYIRQMPTGFLYGYLANIPQQYYEESDAVVLGVIRCLASAIDAQSDLDLRATGARNPARAMWNALIGRNNQGRITRVAVQKIMQRRILGALESGEISVSTKVMNALAKAAIITAAQVRKLTSTQFNNMNGADMTDDAANTIRENLAKLVKGKEFPQLTVTLLKKLHSMALNSFGIADTTANLGEYSVTGGCSEKLEALDDTLSSILALSGKPNGRKAVTALASDEGLLKSLTTVEDSVRERIDAAGATGRRIWGLLRIIELAASIKNIANTMALTAYSNSPAILDLVRIGAMIGSFKGKGTMIGKADRELAKLGPDFVDDIKEVLDRGMDENVDDTLVSALQQIVQTVARYAYCLPYYKRLSGPFRTICAHPFFKNGMWERYIVSDDDRLRYRLWNEIKAV